MDGLNLADYRHGRPGWGATPQPSGEWGYDLEFRSLGDLAAAASADLRRPPVRSQGGRRRGPVP